MEYDSDSERDADTNNIVDECLDIILSEYLDIILSEISKTQQDKSL